jgi:hypothetical protein
VLCDDDDVTRRDGASDEYEANEMTAAGQVVHRDKVVGHELAKFLALYAVGFLGLGLFETFVGWNVPTLARVLTFILAFFFGAVALTRTVLRTVVTTEEIVIRQGLSGPQIPITAVTVCEVLEKVPGKQLPVIGGTHLLLPSMKADIVRIDWTEGGVTKRALLSSSDGPLLVTRIEEARKASVGSQKRVATGSAASTAADDSATLEAESDAEVEGRARPAAEKVG